MIVVEDRECRWVNLTISFWCDGERMDVKGVDDGIECLPDAGLDIADFIDRGAATSPLLSNNIKIPDKFEGTFVVLLAHGDLGGRVLEIVDELVTKPRPKVGLEGIEYRVESTSRLLTPKGIYRGIMARWIHFEQQSSSLERLFQAFHRFLSIVSVILSSISSVGIWA